MPAIGSVRHMGTRFLKLMFKPPILNAHFGENFVYRLEPYFVITPLRRLDRVIQSWVNRDMELHHLHRDIKIMLDYPVDFYLPIDADDREDYLKRLNEVIGTELKTDWKPTGHHGKGRKNEQQEWTDKILNDYSEFWAQFYSSR